MLRILRHPSGYLLLYLLAQRRYVVRGRQIRVEESGSKHVISVAQEHGVRLPPDANGLERLRTELIQGLDVLEPPVMPSSSVQRLAPAHQRFLKKWRIFDLWVKRPAAVAALEVSKNPELRRSLEIMLLGPLQRQDIAAYLRKRWDLSEAEMNLQVVRLFEHYFWNVSCMSLKQWHTFVLEHVPGRCTDYLTAIHATRDPGGMTATIAAADRGGSKTLKPLEMYETMRTHMFQTFMNHARLGKPGFNNTMAMSAAAKAVLELDDNIERLRGGSVEVLEQFELIREEYDPNKPISIRSLPIDRPANPQDIIDTEAEG